MRPPVDVHAHLPLTDTNAVTFDSSALPTDRIPPMRFERTAPSMSVRAERRRRAPVSGS